MIGAVEKTRTSTGVTPQRPQRCASTNSATTARDQVVGGCLAEARGDVQEDSEQFGRGICRAGSDPNPAPASHEKAAPQNGGRPILFYLIMAYLLA